MSEKANRNSNVKIFLFGLIIGILVAIPVGMNLGRDAPVFSNPFAERQVRQKMTGKVKEGAGQAVQRTKEVAGKAVEGTKKKIHEATKPN